MKKKLSIAPSHGYSEQGFVIPIVMGLGLVMILIGSMMLVRSQVDKVTAAAQKSTTDSLGVSEVGITRVQSLFKRFPKMAQQPASNWAGIYTSNSSANNCLSNTQDSNIVNNINNWITVDSSDLTKGEFKVLDYSYTGNVGVLKVAGRARSENGSAATSIGNAANYLEVRIPVVPLVDFTFPGLWAKSFNMGNNQISGNVLVAGCSIPSGISQDKNIVANTGTLNANPSLEFPPLPELPSSGVITIAAITGSTTLPRTTPVVDKPGSDGVYRYLVGKSGNYSIDLKGNDSLTITSTKKVYLYLQGNVSVSGSSNIIYTGTPPTNFQIYGSDGGSHYKYPIDSNSYITNSIILNGNASVNMFLYAPEATAGVNGGGKQPSTITGSVWVKAWDGSSANQVVVTQSANWTDLPVEQPKGISSIQLWQRQQASN